MGSYNVACSVRNLSISSGERVLLLPLSPHFYQRHDVKVCSHLTYSNCYYNPFCLPIEGTYNDYGSIEESKQLLESSLKIVNRRMKKRQEDDV